MNRFLRSFFVASLPALVLPACSRITLNIGGFCHDGEPRYFYVWVGPTGEAPAACPEWATLQVFRLHDGPTAGSLDCPSCTCTPSETTCLPSAEWAAVPRSCAEPPDAAGVFFGATDNWNGVCSTQPSIPAGIECPGGEPCAQSMVVGPPGVLAAPCAVSSVGEPIPSDPPFTWEITALGCVQEERVERKECDPYEFVPFPEDGFLLCFETDQEVCPTGYEPSFTFYHDADDDRACTPCSCGAPSGNTCSMQVSAYSDAGCVSELGAAVVSSTDPEVCFDLPDGTALGSKRAALVEKTDGACAPSGGEVTGSVQAKEPVHMCCQSFD
ncbi:MAG: hypothetical protein R3B70_35955 [Polyangiaceae bacterium]